MQDNDEFPIERGTQTYKIKKKYLLAEVPTKTSEIINDSNFPSDSNYVHTDNNFTSTLKTKLENISTISTTQIDALFS